MGRAHIVTYHRGSEYHGLPERKLARVSPIRCTFALSQARESSAADSRGIPRSSARLSLGLCADVAAIAGVADEDAARTARRRLAGRAGAIAGKAHCHARDREAEEQEAQRAIASEFHFTRRFQFEQLTGEKVR